jgi:2,3-bisphosphoglycerate-dependent phosphoglycerate mutase
MTWAAILVYAALLRPAPLLRPLPGRGRAPAIRADLSVRWEDESESKPQHTSRADIAPLRAQREEDCLLELRDFCAITGGAVVLLRHGESSWNEENRFTGWHDVPLSSRGETQALEAAELIRTEGLCFDAVYVSTLKRTIKTAWVILERLDDFTVPVVTDWRLNERNYGALTGLNKAETRDFLGDDRFEQLRRKPPPIEEGSCYDPARSPRFRAVPEAQLPTGESFEDCRERVRPVWRDEILPMARAGKTVLVVSSKNLLRSLFVEITSIPTDTLVNVDIPNGVPIVFCPATNTLRLLDGRGEGGQQFLSLPARPAPMSSGAGAAPAPWAQGAGAPAVNATV